MYNTNTKFLKIELEKLETQDTIYIELSLAS